MQTKDLTRGERRARRLHAIEHAFDIYWHKWWRHDAFHFNRWQHDKVYLETNEERFIHQDEYRAEVLENAKYNANHLRNCSCWMCSGYKKYEKTHHQIRARYKDADDLADLLDDGV